ncbi:PREDICTED: ubiquitin-like modifier-activating enzyme 6 [Priapulus caudatus]|uniref:Ubiquitin-like modifier-activating enzyme 6 n=1 Tax=Priapulus caudatus TaxID=37621 RepID=A0ABM1EUP5_PRICU|nr:PREDICTED: ubiquitin-like modifier-activating enzyme 6 [Priapulus caudatus]
MDTEIDDSLYSRQRYVLGDSAMQKMARSNVLIVGLGGLGVEIAKDIVLAGVKSLTVQDWKVATYHDLGTQFFLTEDDVINQRNGISICIKSQVLCVILTRLPISLQIKVDNFCRNHSNPIKFIATSLYGMFGSIFCDFGDEFEVIDKNGEEPKEVFVANISKGKSGLVTCLENGMHGFESGNIVTFKEVGGMEKVNGKQFVINVASPYSFSIGDTAGDVFQPYTTGGIAVEVKVPQTVKFRSLEEQIANPDIVSADLQKMETACDVHVGFLALYEFSRASSRLPNVRCRGDAAELTRLATQINGRMKEPVEKLDEELLAAMSYTAQGAFGPLACAIGGIVAQEALKAVTGKFSPLQQWAIVVCFAHVQKSKSVVGADAARQINPQLQILAQQNRVCPQSEQTYSDDFFTRQHVVVNALDNVEARRYIDGRCVTNQRALLDSGTLGAKGHVQVIVPHLTESYSSQQDPVEQDIPYCTVKSFPAVIEHTIQWVRDKFESSFAMKPAMYNKFWTSHGPPDAVVRAVRDGRSLDNLPHVVKVVSSRPRAWTDCLQLARRKFEKYFSHKAKHLRHAFPLDTKLRDGSLFWQSPKRPPSHIQFDICNSLHVDCVVVTAKLYAQVYGLAITEEDLSPQCIDQIISNITVVPWRPSSKAIETDESVTRPAEPHVASIDDLQAVETLLQNAIQAGQLDAGDLALQPLTFEKDDDSNGHVDFMTAVSNLRACMYGIEPVDRLKSDSNRDSKSDCKSKPSLRACTHRASRPPETKRIAGRIVPAIATTTASVAGPARLASSSTVALASPAAGGAAGDATERFLNLALPVIVVAKPAPCQCTQLSDSVHITLWDRWEVKGHKDFTLNNFIKAVRDEHGMTVTMVVHGVKMVYVPIMPGHKKRLTQPMLKLMRIPAGQSYVDLTVSLEDDATRREVAGPPIRYFFK